MFPPDPAESLPYLDIPDSASTGDIIRLIYQCKNPRQQAELMMRLVAGPKDLQVVKLLRSCVNAENARVRAAANEGLQKLFGADKLKPREIPKPVQPPRSDD